MSVNPFRYTEPVSPADLVDRDEETRRIVELALEGNSSRLVAPRRYGKTSLLGRVAAEMPKSWQTVRVDFFGVLTVQDVTERIERAYAEQLSGRLSKWFMAFRRTIRPTLRAGGGAVPVGVEIDLAEPSSSSLLDRLAIPRRLYERHGVRTLVVFDEFPDVLTAEARIDAVIRSEIQHHAQAAGYVFAGSQVGMMENLFGDRRRAFYAQAAPVVLGDLDAGALAEYIDRRFFETDKDVGSALEPLLDLGRGHPQRSMLLAHALWNATDVGHPATEETWDLARRTAMAEVRDELRALWTGLPTGQRRVLATLVSSGGRLYAGPRTGGSRGGAVRQAAQALMDRGEVLKSARGYQIVDPLLAAWIEAGTPS